MRKVYLIVGASSDIGMNYIRHLLTLQMEDMMLLAHYRTHSENFDILLDENKETVVPIQADLADHVQVMEMISDLMRKELYPTHILFLPAPKFTYTRLSEYDVVKMREMLEIQLFSLQEVLKAFIPHMAGEQYGKIVVMLSSCVLGEPPKYMSDYIVCKYALLGLVKSVAAEYGENGININGISPDMIETKFVKGIGRKVREMSAESNPRHRNLVPNDLIGILDYLFSDESGFMNGCNLNLSGKVY